MHESVDDFSFFHPSGGGRGNGGGETSAAKRGTGKHNGRKHREKKFEDWKKTTGHTDGRDHLNMMDFASKE